MTVTVTSIRWDVYGIQYAECDDGIERVVHDCILKRGDKITLVFGTWRKVV